MSKKKTKAKSPTKRKSASKTKKTRPSLWALFTKLFKFGILLGLWGALGVICLTAWYARELPAITKNVEFEHRAAITILANDDSQITRIGELRGLTIQIQDVPNYVRHAFISIEDRRFYTHFGIDPQGIARAIYTKVFRGGRLAGGSTITQQLAKNLFLSHQRSLKRKVQEALLALWLERTLTKDEILSAYLNRVYFGAGAYGIEAAANTYFDKSTQDLNLGEAAILAGLLKAPSRYAPTNNLALAQKRGRLVLNAMVEEGYITRSEAEMQAGLSVTRPKPRPIDADSGRYFADWIMSEAAKLISMPEEHIIIETTLDPELQNTSQGALNQAVTNHGEERKFSQGATLSLGRDGAVYAMVGGVNYRQSQFNRATQALRPSGSALKPFIYLTALENGWQPDDKILDAIITDQESEYQPANYNDKYYGEVTLTDALSKSMNTAAVRLTLETGLGNFIKKLRKFGITADLNRDLSLALGSAGISAIELTAAYAGLMNEGQKVTPYGIKRILTKDGVVLYDRADHRHSQARIAKSRYVERLNTMLNHAVTYGTGRAAQINGVNVYGKTGTSQDTRDAWFIGFTDKITTAVWLGNDDNTPMDHVTGGSFPARIWQDLMRRGLEDTSPAYAHQIEGQSGFSRLLSSILGGSDNAPTVTTTPKQSYDLNE
ncbi:MAG: PBP1A family penicillin-binding protein [Alphaproteobacteria bacterium]|nr:PBP1A family penicillin-binding protein [Alphaproteobacteria bacterium]